MHAGVRTDTDVMMGTICYQTIACNTITGMLPNLLCSASLKGELLWKENCWSVVAAPPGLDAPVVVRAGLAVPSIVMGVSHHRWASAPWRGSWSGQNPSGPQPLRHSKKPKDKRQMCAAIKLKLLVSFLPKTSLSALTCKQGFISVPSAWFENYICLLISAAFGKRK